MTIVWSVRTACETVKYACSSFPCLGPCPLANLQPARHSALVTVHGGCKSPSVCEILKSTAEANGVVDMNIAIPNWGLEIN